MQATKTRDTYIDIVKGIAILLVVVGHTLVDLTDVKALNTLFNFIYSFHMPLFFFLSGYVEETYRSNYREKELQMLKKRTLSLILPYFSWTIISCFINKNISLSTLSSLLFRLLGYHQDGLWFLAVMWELKCCHYIFWIYQKKVVNRPCGLTRLFINIIFLFLLESFLIVFAFITKLPYVMNLISYFIPYFFAVLLVDSPELQMFAAKSFFSVLAILTYAFVFPFFSFHNTSWTTQLLRIILSLCVILLLYKLKITFSLSSFSLPYLLYFHKCFVFLGQATIEIYLLHSYFLRLGPDFSTISSVPLLIICIFLFCLFVCFLCITIARLIKVLPYLSIVLFGK